MPLNIQSIKDEKTVRYEPIPLTGEMSEHDFGGLKNLNWYHQTFSLKNNGESHNEEFRAFKRFLAAWMSNPDNINGPYYIVEDVEQRPSSHWEFLHITLPNPHDILAFQAAWSEHFTFDQENARKNLLMDINRIDAGFEPEDPRLKAVYERFRQLDAPEFDAAQRGSILVNSYILPEDLAVLKPSEPEI